MMTRNMATAKRLTDMVIDEVSFVDRAANQHSTVAFAKNDGTTTMEDTMPVLEQEVPDLFDVDGDAVDPDLLEHGDVVYAEDGTELVYVEDDDDTAELDYDWDDSYDDEVGKSFGAAVGRGKKAFRSGYKFGRENVRSKPANAKEFFTGQRAGGARSHIKPTKGGMMAGTGDETLGGKRMLAARAGEHLGRNRARYIAGGAGAGALGLGGAAYGLSKSESSLGEQVLEELSKAASNDEREFVIAKAMDEVEIAKAAAAEAWEQVEEERDARLEMEFISKAADYNLPISDDDFGPILKRLVERMEPEDVEVLDQIFKAAGDFIYDEVGYVGGGDNASIIDSVSAAADELVGKSDMTNAEASVALMAADPSLYDAYLAEQGQ